MTNRKLTRQQIKQAKALLRRESLAVRSAATSLAESGHKNETDKHSHDEPYDHSTSKSTTKRTITMSGWVSSISILVCGLLFCVFLGYWFSRGYENVRTGFYWLALASFFLMVAILSSYWYYVVRPARAVKEKPASVRPYVTATGVTLQNFIVGQKPRVVIEYTARGQIAAQKVRISSRITLSTEADLQPNYIGLQIVKIDPILAPPTKMSSTVFASWDLTQQRRDEITSGKRWIYAYGTIEYSDEAGNSFDPYRYCFRYDARSGGFAFYTPPDRKKIEDYLTPNDGTPIEIDRPKIVVTEIALGDVAVDAHPRYEVVTKNVSLNKAAPKAVAQAFIALMTIPMSETPEYPRIAREQIEYTPREEHFANLTADFTLNAGDFQAMKDKRAWLYVYGFVDYEDEAGRPYKTKFCGWYDPDTRKLALCDHHNSAD